MTNEEILSAAKDSYLDHLHLKRGGEKHYILDLGYPEIERFAAIIEKRTIERCAAVCEKEADQMVDGSCTAYSLKECTAAIRALGEQ